MSLRHSESLMVISHRMRAQCSNNPARVNGTGAKQGYGKLIPSQEKLGYGNPDPMEFSCPYPESPHFSPSNGTPMTSVANFWCTWQSKNVEGFFSVNPVLEGFFSVLITYAEKADINGVTK